MAYGVYLFNLAGAGIFIGTSAADDVAQTARPFAFLNDFAVNAGGTVVFSADLVAGGKGVFTGHGTLGFTGPYASIADTSGPFSSLGSAAINADGTVAFAAGLDAGGKGIFTGSDPLLDKVVETGDPLAGSFITDLGFFNQGLNDSGELAFYAKLADGRHGIFRADQLAVPAASPVPEPSSLSLFVALGCLGLAAARRRQTA